MKIIGIDENSQSLLVSFSDLENEPNDNNAVAFQPYFFGDIPKTKLYESIAMAGISMIENQNKIDAAKNENIILNYSEDVGKTLEIEIPQIAETTYVEDTNANLIAMIRAVLYEEGLIK